MFQQHDRSCSYGKWEQCHNCGATYWGKRWHFAGFESKVEPTCSLSRLDNKEWFENAKDTFTEAVQSELSHSKND
jgi:hypothetical protein